MYERPHDRSVVECRVPHSLLLHLPSEKSHEHVRLFQCCRSFSCRDSSLCSSKFHRSILHPFINVLAKQRFPVQPEQERCAKCLNLPPTLESVDKGVHVLTVL